MPSPSPSGRGGGATPPRSRTRSRNPSGIVALRPAAHAGSDTDDRIYATIHAAVLDHRLPPGTKLKEVQLAQMFGVTRTAIRKALSRLAHTRLVELRPNRGATVATPTLAESRDLFAARVAIEGAIVATLAASIRPEQLRELRALVRSEHAAYDRGDIGEGLKVSIEFHRALARMAGNAVLAEFLEQLVSRTPLVVLTHQGLVADKTCRSDEHAEVVDALAAGDAGRALGAMRTHLEELLARLNLQQHEPPEADLAAILGVGTGAS
jgi:DNA-binding GntR family transcriptional regulator